MSGLFGLLDLGSSALLAQQAGIAVTGRNTANVGTEGYSRESVDLRSELGAPLAGGVYAAGVYRHESSVLSKRERSASGQLGYYDSMRAALAGLEGDLAPQGPSLVSSLSDLFGGLSNLAAAPMSDSLRQSIVGNAQAVVNQFHRAAADIASARSNADKRIIDLTDEASRLSQRIADANKKLQQEMDPTLADARDLAAKKLAELVGGQARVDPDGKMRFVASGGVVLVDGDRAARLVATRDPRYGNHVRVDVVDNGRDSSQAFDQSGNVVPIGQDDVHINEVTATLDGGRIAGEIRFRDVHAAAAATRLDQLAFDFANRMNAQHRAGAGLDGVSGRDFFVPPGAVPGAAAALTLDPTIAADPSRIAAAAAGSGPGSSANALALAQLKDALGAAGNTRTFSDEAISTIGSVGLATRSASDQLSLEQARTDALKAARDDLSGVSTEEELQRLAQFQHASEAATRFVSTVNDLLNNLISSL